MRGLCNIISLRFRPQRRRGVGAVTPSSSETTRLIAEWPARRALSGDRTEFLRSARASFARSFYLRRSRVISDGNRFLCNEKKSDCKKVYSARANRSAPGVRGRSRRPRETAVVTGPSRPATASSRTFVAYSCILYDIIKLSRDRVPNTDRNLNRFRDFGSVSVLIYNDENRGHSSGSGP